MKTKILALLIMLFFSGLAATAQDWEQVIKSVASDRAAGDEFGCSVAISGDYAVVGSWFDDEDENGQNTIDAAGSVYIFQKSGSTWQQIQKIVASDRDVNDHFGYSVAISGNYIFVGAPYENEDANGQNTKDDAGSVYVFQNNSGNWEETQKIAASNRMSGDFFGCSIATSGNYMFLGAKNQNYDGNNENFMNNAGAAYIFYNNSGTWEEVKKVAAPDRESGAAFGTFVSISGNYAIVGAPSETKDVNGENPLDYAGAAYVFYNESGNWQFVQKLTASDRQAHDNFGCTGSVSDVEAIIGARSRNYLTGAAYCFHNTNESWVQQQIMLPSDANDSEFGYSVSISGDFAIIGARNGKTDASGNNVLSYAGAAYIIRNNSGTWEHVQKLVASDRAAEDYFGLSTAISNNCAIIGAQFEDEDALGTNTLNLSGSAYIFEDKGPFISEQPLNRLNQCVNSQVPFLISGENFDTFQWQVSIDGGLSYSNISESAPYSGTQTSTLTVNTNISLNAFQYRCIVTNSYRSEISIAAKLTLDEEAPQINCVENQIIALQQGQTIYTVSGTGFDISSMEDNCEIASITNDYNNQSSLDGAQFTEGTTKVTWTVTDNAGNSTSCSFDVIISKTTSISEFQETTISIYPNPVNNFIIINGLKSNTEQIKLTDLQGKTIYQNTKIPKEGILDLSNLKSGIYILTIQTEQCIFSEKIVKN